jgi:hypothetical protein
MQQDEMARMEQYLKHLFQQGVLVDFKPLPAAVAIDNRVPITVAEPPLSETIIADRR